MGDGKISFKVDGQDVEIDESLKDWAVVGCGGERWLGQVRGLEWMASGVARDPFGILAAGELKDIPIVNICPGIELSSLPQTVIVLLMERQPKEGMQAVHDGMFLFNKLSMHPVPLRWVSIQWCALMSKASHGVCLSIVRSAIDRAMGVDRRVQRAGGGLIPGRQ